jgi:hypothetical protein
MAIAIIELSSFITQARSFQASLPLFSEPPENPPPGGFVLSGLEIGREFRLSRQKPIEKDGDLYGD